LRPTNGPCKGRYLLIERNQVQIVRLQRSQRERFGRIEPLSTAITRHFEQTIIGVELRDQGKRKITPDPIDARQHHTGVRTATTNTLAQHEAPDGAGQVSIEPTILKLLTADEKALLEPSVPGIDKFLRHTPLQKIPFAGKLPIEACCGFGLHTAAYIVQ
jgi:hypothetical protein